ncbi:MAG TPA: hypothetical protein VK168_13030, partial [Saprospiraceae bacterium]|nr:hypothetical protein [Saprospiraceae bacterium]
MTRIFIIAFGNIAEKRLSISKTPKKAAEGSIKNPRHPRHPRSLKTRVPRVPKNPRSCSGNQSSYDTPLPFTLHAPCRVPICGPNL